MESNQAEKTPTPAKPKNSQAKADAEVIAHSGQRANNGPLTPSKPVLAKAATVEVEAYWIEREKYLKQIKKIPELRRKYFKSALAYLIRRFLWSFTFFPVFIAFWIPLVLNRFNLVVTIKQVLPSLQAFIEANPQSQAATVETLFIAWISIGITFAIFDFILTPFKNPYTYEADVHMRAWEELHMLSQK